MKRWNLCAVIIFVAALAACGGGGAAGNSTGPGGTTGGPTGGPSGGTNNTNQVTMVNQSFSPGAVTVSAGTTVTWTWPTCDTTGSYGYGSCVSHSIVFDDGSGITSPEQSEGTFARTFTAVGTFKYHCGVHGQTMNGQVVVQ